MKSIQVSDDVHKQLIQLRNQFGFKHYSMTIQRLIESYQPAPKKIEPKPKSTEQSILTEQDQSIKHKLIDLMLEWPNRTWLSPEFNNKVMSWLNLQYDEAKKYIELLLPKITEIEKVHDVKFGDGTGYRLIE